MKTLKNKIVLSNKPLIIPEIPVEYPEEFPLDPYEDDDENEEDSYHPIKSSSYT